MPPLKSVAIAPGATVLTVIPARPSSFARYRVKTSTAPFIERVGGTPRKRKARQSRRDIHDPAAVVDQRQKLLRQEEHALEVDVVEAVQLLLGRLLDGVVVRGAGVVDQIIEALGAQSCQRLRTPLHERVEGADVAGVELQGDGLAPASGDQADDVFGFRPVRVVGED